MALDTDIVALIRDEIGNDADFADDIDDFDLALHLDSLENIYNDTDRGNSNVLKTALICWKRRRNHLQARSWDVATEGSLLTRSQRLKQMDQQIKRYEARVDDTYTGRNHQVRTPKDVEEDARLANASEFT